MDELTTSIVGIDFPNEDQSKCSRRMEGMLCAPGDLIELRLEPTNPFDANAVAIFSNRGTQLGYVSAERAPLIGKRMREDEATAVFQAMHGAYILIRFGGGLPTLPDRILDIPKPTPLRPMRSGPRPGTIPMRSILMTRARNSVHDRQPAQQGGTAFFDRGIGTLSKPE